MRNYLIILTGILLIFACNNNNIDIAEEDVNISDDNALLANKVEVDERIRFENVNNPNWVKSFDNIEFVETVFLKIFSGEFKHVNIWEQDDSVVNYIRERMGERIDTLIIFNNNTKQNDTSINKKEIDLSEIKEIYFEEEWFFNKVNLSFNKDVSVWTPIRVYHRADDIKKKDTRYKKIFQIKKDGNSKFLNKVAENYTYIFEFYTEYENRTGLDKKGFFKFILQNIESGKIKTYDPIYLVDKSKREFTTEQLKNYAGISLDSEEFNDEVNKMIFIEDWFFDEKTFNISKKVKGIGFIADRKVNGEWQDKILFFIFFD